MTDAITTRRPRRGYRSTWQGAGLGSAGPPVPLEPRRRLHRVLALSAEELSSVHEVRGLRGRGSCRVSRGLGPDRHPIRALCAISCGSGDGPVLSRRHGAREGAALPWSQPGGRRDDRGAACHTVRHRASRAGSWRSRGAWRCCPDLPQIVAPAWADEDGDENDAGGATRRRLKRLHEAFANLMLLLVALHVGGVVPGIVAAPREPCPRHGDRRQARARTPATSPDRTLPLPRPTPVRPHPAPPISAGPFLPDGKLKRKIAALSGSAQVGSPD